MIKSAEQQRQFLIWRRIACVNADSDQQNYDRRRLQPHSWNSSPIRAHGAPRRSFVSQSVDAGRGGLTEWHVSKEEANWLDAASAATGVYSGTTGASGESGSGQDDQKALGGNDERREAAKIGLFFVIGRAVHQPDKLAPVKGQYPSERQCIGQLTL